MQACELVAVELRLDRIDAELAVELPPHMRAFARAYARGEPLPPAPELLRRAGTHETAREALAHPLLADRGIALARLVAPLAIEADPRVVAARAVEPSWEALAALADARDAAATALFGRGALEILHRLHGASDPPDRAGATAMVPVPVPGWFEPDGIPLDIAAVSHAWDAIRAHHGVDGAVRFERTTARPRTFVVRPRGEVVVAIPAQVATPAGRFRVLHELGHVLAALALPAGIPRVVDEAAAAYVARAIEREAEPWFSAAARPARARRLALARQLDHIERGRLAHAADVAAPALDATAWPARPPWALWHDPGAQAAYVAAEAMADALEHDLGAAPPPGALAAALAEQREPIDRRVTSL
jgi:hypothetical protein